MVLRAVCALWMFSVLLQVALASELKTSVIHISKISPGSKDSRSNITKDTKQPSLSSDKVSLIVELAMTSEEQEKGLMFRKSLATGRGMLFVFGSEMPRQFWMKNTLIPLSIAFIDEKKTIFQISDLNPVKTLLQKTYDRAESVRPAKYVLEVPQGWFLVNKIKVGSKFEWPEEKKFTDNK